MCYTSQMVSILSFYCKLKCLIDCCHTACFGAVSYFLEVPVEEEYLGFNKQVEILTFLKINKSM